MENQQNKMFISRRKAIAGLLATGTALTTTFATTPSSFAASLSAFATNPTPQKVKATIKTSKVASKQRKLTGKSGKATLKRYALKTHTQAAPLTADATATFTEYPVKTTSNPYLYGITKGDTGSDFWFTEDEANRLGKITTQGAITEYLLPLEKYHTDRGIANGPGDAIWFAYAPTVDVPGFPPYYIGRIVGGSGEITLYQLPDTLVKIVAIGPIVRGSDDALWFATGNGVGGTLGRVTPDGDLTMYAIDDVTYVYCLAAGPDGALWFDVYNSDQSKNGIGRFTTSGDFTLYAMPNTRFDDITAGATNDLWFSFDSENIIGRMTTDGQLTQYNLPNNTQPGKVSRVSSGTIAFSGLEPVGDGMPTDVIGTLTLAGDVELFTMPNGSVVHDMIYAGWSNEVWFTTFFSIRKFRLTS